jgi:hypothetical protein
MIPMPAPRRISRSSHRARRLRCRRGSHSRHYSTRDWYRCSRHSILNRRRCTRCAGHTRCQSRRRHSHRANNDRRQGRRSRRRSRHHRRHRLRRSIRSIWLALENILLSTLHPTALLVVIRRNPLLRLNVIARCLVPRKHLLCAFDALVRLVFTVHGDLSFGERLRCSRSACDIAFESLHVPVIVLALHPSR